MVLVLWVDEDVVEEEVEDEAAGSAGANDLTAVYTHTLTNLTGTFFFFYS